MRDGLMEGILDSYKKTAEEAISMMSRAIAGARDHPDAHGEIRREGGICAAKLAAASKVAKRSLVFEFLIIEKEENSADLTTTNVQHFAKTILGRAFDNRAVIETFATKGRTAANKSSLTAGDLIDIEARLKRQMSTLIMRMGKARKDLKKRYAT